MLPPPRNLKDRAGLLDRYDPTRRFRRFHRASLIKKALDIHFGMPYPYTCNTKKDTNQPHMGSDDIRRYLIEMKREKDDKLVQTAVRLPSSLRDRLCEAGGERGLGEEIRRRLEASFDTEKDRANAQTRELLDAVASFAWQVAMYYGDPASDPFAADVLKACIDLLMTRDRPNGEAVPHPTEVADMVFSPDHSVEAVSRVLVSGRISEQARRAFGDKEKRR
jgi:hypothetical protein